MKQFSALDSITLEAFQSTLKTFQDRGLALPEQIANIAAQPDSYIDELDALSECDPAFEALYQANRLKIQGQAAQRTKRLSKTSPHSSKTNGSEVLAGNSNIRSTIRIEKEFESLETQHQILFEDLQREADFSQSSVSFKTQSRFSRPPEKPITAQEQRSESFWDHLSRITVMMIGGAFIGGMTAQILSDNETVEFLAVVLGVFGGLAAELYVTATTNESNRSR